MSNNFKRAARKVDKLEGRIKRHTSLEMMRGVDDLVYSMRHYLAVKRGVASGTLINGINSTTSTANAKAYFGQQVLGPDYWRYVEFGTGMGSKYKAASPQAPLAPIYRWVLAKGIFPREDEPYSTQLQLAQAIAYSIRTGTKAKKFARPAWRGIHGKSHIKRRTEKGLERAIERTF